MNKKQLLIIGVLAVIFLLFFIVAILVSKKEIRPPTAPEKAQAEMEGASAKKEVKVFLLEESGRFIKTEKDIMIQNSLQENVRNYVALLLSFKGKDAAPLPENITLRTLFYLASRNMLVLDFNSESLEKFPSGTEAELEFIYFIVNNICYNFAEIKRVQFLFDGKQVTALRGHLDMEAPFLPDFSLLRNE